MTTHVTRRTALAVGISAAAGLLGGSASGAPVPKADDNKSWVGKTVMPQKLDPTAYQIVPGGPGDPPVELRQILHAASWEVKAEEGRRVEVIEDGQSFWLDKGEVVPLADAVEFYTKQIKENEKSDYPYNFRGWARYLLGKPDEALKDFDEFLKRYPPGGGESADVHRAVGLSNRGMVLAEIGKFDAAFKDLDEAVKLGHTPARLNRGWAYELKGEYKKAEDDYAAILNIRPADALALNNMAWLKATCPDKEFRDGKEAVKFAKKVCDLSGNREGMFLDTLAAAHAEAGDFAAAIKAQEKALDDKGYTRKYGADAQKRLQLYKDKKPFRSEPLK